MVVHRKIKLIVLFLALVVSGTFKEESQVLKMGSWPQTCIDLPSQGEGITISEYVHCSASCKHV